MDRSPSQGNPHRSRYGCNPMDFLYFAYGSNLRSAQMERLCPGHQFLGTVRLDGHRLAFTCGDEEWGGGVADAPRAAGCEVWGALYRIEAAGLAALDDYEGYAPGGSPGAHIYVRRTVEVQSADGRTWSGVECYFVNKPRRHVPPSDRYRKALRDGAVERGLPASYVAGLRSLLLEKD